MKATADVGRELQRGLRELCLSAMQGCYEDLARTAVQEAWSHERFLLELVHHECQVRRQHRIERLLKDSRLPLDKSLQAFELPRLPVKLRQQVAALLDGSFLDRRENVLAFGNPGSGKTHLLCAPAHEACFVREAGADPPGTPRLVRHLCTAGAGASDRQA
jgi:DNA replication protein DnaC